MESIEAKALKSSLLSEFSVKSNHHHLNFKQDDLCYVNAGNADDFSVDVFLNLSNNDLQVQGDLSEQGTEESLSSRDRVEEENDASNCSMFSDSLDSSFFPDELIVPEDDFEDLEWLSRFADDSATELIIPFSPTGNSNRNWLDPLRKPSIQTQSTPLLCFPVPVPAKTRTKRDRPSGKIWSSSSSSSSNEPSFNKSEQSLVEPRRPAAKPKKKARVSPEICTEAVGAKAQSAQRRCTHCEVQKTPQWRRGPLGPKTLCNACGVRFKSGRLFPEYRPACSPTFSGEVHSNSHRRVLEMRNRNESDVVVAV